MKTGDKNTCWAADYWHGVGLALAVDALGSFFRQTCPLDSILFQESAGRAPPRMPSVMLYRSCS